MTKTQLHAILGDFYEKADKLHNILLDNGINLDCGQYNVYFDDTLELLYVVAKLPRTRFDDPMNSTYTIHTKNNPSFNSSLPEHPRTNPKFLIYPVISVHKYECIQNILFYTDNESDYLDYSRKSQTGSLFVDRIATISDWYDNILSTGFKEDLDSYVTAYRSENPSGAYITFSAKNFFEKAIIDWAEFEGIDIPTYPSDNLAILGSKFNTVKDIVENNYLPEIDAPDSLTNIVIINSTLSSWYDSLLTAEFKSDLADYATAYQSDFPTGKYANYSGEDFFQMALLKWRVNENITLASYNTDLLIAENSKVITVEDLIDNAYLQSVTGASAFTNPILNLLEYWYDNLVSDNFKVDLEKYTTDYQTQFPEGEYVENNAEDFFKLAMNAWITDQDIDLSDFDRESLNSLSSKVLSVNEMVINEYLPEITDSSNLLSPILNIDTFNTWYDELISISFKIDLDNYLTAYQSQFPTGDYAEYTAEELFQLAMEKWLVDNAINLSTYNTDDLTADYPAKRYDFRI